MQFSVFVELERVHDILPQHVTACAHRCHGMEIGVGHPDGEGGILLEHGLATANLIAQMLANGTAHQEQGETEDETHHGYHEQYRQGGIGMHDVAHGDTRGDTELHRPEIERQIGDAHYPGTGTLGVMLHEPP